MVKGPDDPEHACLPAGQRHEDLQHIRVGWGVRCLVNSIGSQCSGGLTSVLEEDGINRVSTVRIRASAVLNSFLAVRDGWHIVATSVLTCE